MESKTLVYSSASSLVWDCKLNCKVIKTLPLWSTMWTLQSVNTEICFTEVSVFMSLCFVSLLVLQLFRSTTALNKLYPKQFTAISTGIVECSKMKMWPKTWWACLNFIAAGAPQTQAEPLTPAQSIESWTENGASICILMCLPEGGPQNSYYCSSPAYTCTQDFISH